MGDGQYWGHNAIIRIAPFMQYCALPRLSGKPPLGGDIFSHDFVEAALIGGRAGTSGSPTTWAGVRGAPPILLDALEGPALVPGEPPAPAAALHAGDLPRPPGALPERSHVLPLGPALARLSRGQHRRGACSKPSSNLTISRGNSVCSPIGRCGGRNKGPGPDGGYGRHSLFAQAARRRLRPAASAPRPGFRGWGDGSFLGVFAEVLLSSLYAPIRMLFHSKFVFLTLLGKQTGWGQPESRKRCGDRNGAKPSGFTVSNCFSGCSGAPARSIGSIPPSSGGSRRFSSPYVLSIPLSVYCSRVGARSHDSAVRGCYHPRGTPPAAGTGLAAPPPRSRPLAPPLRWPPHGWAVFAGPSSIPRVADSAPGALAAGGAEGLAVVAARRSEGFGKRHSAGDRTVWTAAEKKALLYDPASLKSAVHRAVWRLPDEELAKAWGLLAPRVR